MTIVLQILGRYYLLLYSVPRPSLYGEMLPPHSLLHASTFASESATEMGSDSI